MPSLCLSSSRASMALLAAVLVVIYALGAAQVMITEEEQKLRDMYEELDTYLTKQVQTGIPDDNLKAVIKKSNELVSKTFNTKLYEAAKNFRALAEDQSCSNEALRVMRDIIHTYQLIGSEDGEFILLSELKAHRIVPVTRPYRIRLAKRCTPIYGHKINAFLGWWKAKSDPTQRHYLMDVFTDQKLNKIHEENSCLHLDDLRNPQSYDCSLMAIQEWFQDHLDKVADKDGYYKEWAQRVDKEHDELIGANKKRVYLYRKYIGNPCHQFLGYLRRYFDNLEAITSTLGDHYGGEFVSWQTPEFKNIFYRYKMCKLVNSGVLEHFEPPKQRVRLSQAPE